MSHGEEGTTSMKGDHWHWQQVTRADFAHQRWRAAYDTAPCEYPAAGLGRSRSHLLLLQNCDWGLRVSGHSWAFRDSPSCSCGQVKTMIRNTAGRPLGRWDGAEDKRNLIRLICWHWEDQSLAWCPQSDNTTNTSIVRRGLAGCRRQGVISLSGTYRPQQCWVSKSVRLQLA